MSEVWARKVRPKMVKPFTPRVPNYTKPFWEGLAKKELRIQKCSDCGHSWYPPGPFCPKCMSKNIEWKVSNGVGYVGAFTTTYAASPSWVSHLMPYTIVVVGLIDMVVPMVSHIIGIDPEEIKIGMEVEIIIEETDGKNVPPFRFKPTGKMVDMSLVTGK